MVPLASLVVPILVSAALVFVASSVVHMVLPHHRTDFARLPNEDQVMAALRPFAIPPGDYAMPCGGGPAAMKDPAFLQKFETGPVATMTFVPLGPPSMGKELAMWFVYCAVVSLLSAYVTGRAVAAGTDYLQVFRFAGTVAFIAYTVANWQNSIWYKRAWSTTLKNTLDGLLYGLLTAGVFGWLWPR